MRGNSRSTDREDGRRRPSTLRTLDFMLPAELEAGEPPKARDLARDEVRLMLSSGDGERIEHARFRDLPRFLKPGDVVVINTSGTLNAALPATRADGARLALHLSTRLPDGRWVVEVRQPDGVATKPFRLARAGERLLLSPAADAYPPGLEHPRVVELEPP